MVVMYSLSLEVAAVVRVERMNGMNARTNKSMGRRNTIHHVAIRIPTALRRARSEPGLLGWYRIWVREREL